MNNKTRKLNQLELEKNKLEVLANHQVTQMKDNFITAKSEGRSVLINKVLIPAGAALLVGYGIKKLISAWRSDDGAPLFNQGSKDYEADPPVYHPGDNSKQMRSNGLFSNVDWAALAVRVVPFVLSIGKKMYQDGHLPFFEPPTESRSSDL